MATGMTADVERRYWLALQTVPDLGPRKCLRLLEYFGSARAVFDASATTLAELALSAAQIDAIVSPGWEKIAPALTWLQDPEHHLLTLADPLYPSLLKEIPDPPPVLYVIGAVELLSCPQISIVGSRAPTAGGIDSAHSLARQLAATGLVVTSGLALGIDAASHQGALAAKGRTIAVMGTGPDIIYPRRHQQLAEQISGQGALVTEYWPGTPPRPENFPRRNRIISGLGVGVLVVEAALKSGSLITARLAMEQGRNVFAVPGSIHNRQVRGCHALIREGAKLVECLDDVVEELGALLQSSLSAGRRSLHSTEYSQTNANEYRTLLQSMGYDPVSVDTLVARSGLTANEVSSMLLILELQGQVSSLPGGYYMRRPEQVRV